MITIDQISLYVVIKQFLWEKQKKRHVITTKPVGPSGGGKRNQCGRHDQVAQWKVVPHVRVILTQKLGAVLEEHFMHHSAETQQCSFECSRNKEDRGGLRGHVGDAQ